MTRWVGVGRSASVDSHAAGMAAARDAVTGADAKLVLVFAAITHDLAAVQAGVLEVAGAVPLIGCTTHGEIGPGGPCDGTVIVAALGGAGFSVGTAVAEPVSGNQREAGAKVAAEANSVEDRPHQVLVLLTDGMIRDQEEILRGCYSIVGAQVPLFGGAAADGWRMAGTQLMADGKVLSDAVVAAMIGSDAPLRDASLVDLIRDVLDRTGVPASALWLEITESGVIEDPEGSLATLHALRELGLTLCIDDFGTGYSSLNYLRRFPAGIVKIDRAFIDGVGQDADDEAIVRTVIAMAHALGQQVVAEGVETTLHRDWLRAHGCDLVQGWLYGKPQPAAAQTELLDADAASHTDCATRLTHLV